MTGEDRRVLIVGAGVGGLATSALLAQHGVRSLLVDRRHETFVYPKARNLSFRSLEILRGLGLGDEVHAVAERVSTMVVKPTLASTAPGHPAIDMDAIFAGLDAVSPEPAAQYCPQSESEPMLLRAARTRGSEVRYGTELVSFEQDGDGVSAILADRESGRSQIVWAEYLIAADGVHSPIRKALSVPTSGYGALPIFVVFIYFRCAWRRFAPDLTNGDAVQISNPAAPGIFLAVDEDRGMFITTYFPAKGETAQQFTPERCAELVTAAIGQRAEVQIIEVASWQPYEQVADQFCCGRVLLVGDCAHTMPPFKAGGANTAIQSAHNLAWKLAAVLQGRAGPALLSSYHSERHPVGRFAAHQSLTGPTLATLELGDQRPRLAPEQECSMFELLIGYRYRSAAVLTDDPDPGALELVQELRGQPGTRVPHVWLQRDGNRMSTLDLLGPRFTLLSADERWRAAAAGLQVAMHRIDEPEWLDVTGLGATGALLVRPDDFVGWRVEEMPDDPAGALQQALSAILALG
ncbi:FAD-dependent monooxygenase [Mycobacterium sp. TY815]|uniref:FAD-dependent monooxygenase n=1 Tax=Mycobacterium sp. TY815 TaxID=3050581 RepID=UPI002740F2EE|nr:FAD-dependent monooxygenase [Mycobacterium sp. TY815]MDP7701374.1 FAD-dependent monooxygenase [Mycobacterium sp. TY815]